jgi:hypothetical protein
MLLGRIRLMPGRRHLVMLLHRPVVIAVAIAVSLIVVVITVVADIRRVVLLWWREGTVAFIGSSVVRISCVRVAVARVHARFAR